MSCSIDMHVKHAQQTITCIRRIYFLETLHSSSFTSKHLYLKTNSRHSFMKVDTNTDFYIHTHTYTQSQCSPVRAQVCVWGVRGVCSDRWRGAAGDRPQEQDSLNTATDSNRRDAVGHRAFPSHLRDAKTLPANQRAGQGEEGQEKGWK